MCINFLNIFKSKEYKIPTEEEKAGINAIKKYISKSERKWYDIVIHHSLSEDGITRDWEAIRKYHMSWRYNSNIISREKAMDLILMGKNVAKPYVDIGYHCGIELIGTRYVYRKGRSLEMEGAACYQEGMNRTGIQICIIGNFDINTPTKIHYWLTASLCKYLMEAYNITIEHVYPHGHFAGYKLCPGKNWDWNKFIHMIGDEK